MSTELSGRGAARPSQRVPIAIPVEEGRALTDEALEFVRFCYRRRPVAWPALYDEMCAVAARGAFRGLGFDELSTIGVSFALGELPRLAALVDRVETAERGAARTVPEAPGVAALGVVAVGGG